VRHERGSNQPGKQGETRGHDRCCSGSNGAPQTFSDHRRGGSRLACDGALIDGEAVVLRKDGRSDFRALLTKRGGTQASLKT
jgi:hypothetical protein